MYRAFTVFAILALCLTATLASRCKVNNDLAEIQTLDSNFWAALDAATINAGILGWSNQTIFDNFKNNVLLPHVTADFKITLPEGAGTRTIQGIDDFAQFAVDAYARGLRAEFHVSGSLSTSCIDKDRYLVEKFDVELAKTIASASTIYGRKKQVFLSTASGLRIESLNLTVHGVVPLAAAIVLPVL